MVFDEENNENKKDEKGEEILSKLNEEELQNIAQNGQGIYQHLSSTEKNVELIANQINSIEQKNFGDTLFVDYNSYFQYFLAIALLLLIIDFLIPSRKKIAVTS